MSIESSNFITVLTGYASSISDILQYVLLAGMVIYIVFLAGYTIQIFLKLKNPKEDNYFKQNAGDSAKNTQKTPKIEYLRDTEIDIRDSLYAVASKAYFQTVKQEQKSFESFFFNDALFSFAINFYNKNIISPYIALVNLLPPLGFLGTVIGMMNLFIHKDGAISSSIKSSSMGTAMLSTIAALLFYIIYDFFRIKMNRDAEECIAKSIYFCENIHKEHYKEIITDNDGKYNRKSIETIYENLDKNSYEDLVKEIKKEILNQNEDKIHKEIQNSLEKNKLNNLCTYLISKLESLSELDNQNNTERKKINQKTDNLKSHISTSEKKYSNKLTSKKHTNK